MSSALPSHQRSFDQQTATQSSASVGFEVGGGSVSTPPTVQPHQHTLLTVQPQLPHFPPIVGEAVGEAFSSATASLQPSAHLIHDRGGGDRRGGLQYASVSHFPSHPQIRPYIQQLGLPPRGGASHGGACESDFDNDAPASVPVRFASLADSYGGHRQLNNNRSTLLNGSQLRPHSLHQLSRQALPRGGNALTVPAATSAVVSSPVVSLSRGDPPPVGGSLLNSALVTTSGAASFMSSSYGGDADLFATRGLAGGTGTAPGGGSGSRAAYLFPVAVGDWGSGGDEWKLSGTHTAGSAQDTKSQSGMHRSSSKGGGRGSPMRSQLGRVSSSGTHTAGLGHQAAASGRVSRGGLHDDGSGLLLLRDGSGGGAAAAANSSATAFASGEDFDTMVGDLRRTFIGWLKKTDGELRRERDALLQSKSEFESERQRLLAEMERQKKIELERLNEERRLAQVEVANATKQITVEREDARRKINEDRSKFEHEKEQNRRKVLIEREKFRREYELFEAERRRIVDSTIATETMADINVGGVVFQSARHTLVQQPGSFLEALFSGRHKVARDRQGRVFIDRDSELFRSILNFLREPTNPPLPREAAESDAIIREANFYGIRFFPFPLVFACGGHNGFEHLRAVEVLDVGQQCWRPCRPMETERVYFGGAVLQSRLHCFGGQNLDYKALCDMEVYDGLRDCWSAGPSLNVARRNTCAAVVGERMYAVGGFDGSSILSSVEAYDPRMKGWMEVAPLTTPRSSAAAAVQNDMIYVLGGTRGERLRTVETYDMRMNRWTPLDDSDMIEVRSAACATSVGGDVLVFGGTDSAHNIHPSVESYGGDSLRWTFRRNMKVARMDGACTAVSESLIVSGGQHGEVLDSTEFYRPELDEWQAGPSMLFPRYGHSMLLVNL